METIYNLSQEYGQTNNSPNVAITQEMVCGPITITSEQLQIGAYETNIDNNQSPLFISALDIFQQPLPQCSAYNAQPPPLRFYLMPNNDVLQPNTVSFYR